MNSTAVLPTIMLALLLGLRHGIDWDHIAAITDITGTAGSKRYGFILGLVYALGHAFVIVVFGLAAILIGARLPVWIDAVMERVVGFTLILLGIWLIYSIMRHGHKFRSKSRWMLLFMLFNKVSDSIHHKLAHRHRLPHIHLPENYGKRTAFTVGMIHGIGAETPTQVLLFLTAAGVGGPEIGSFLLFMFVAGLIISNTIITGIATAGFLGAEGNSKITIALGLITAIFSLAVGTLFLFHQAILLPAFFGG